MKKINKKGFTLIELLVVIAIIGLLSTMAVISLNSARMKARDAKRVSDIKQISTLIEMAAANTGDGSYATAMAACNTDQMAISGCTIDGQALTAFVDPNAPAATDCNGTAPVACNYTLAAVPDAANYEIAFYLENGAGNLTAGNGCIQEGGVIASISCPGLP